MSTGGTNSARAAAAFTLLEMLIGIFLLAVAMSMAFGAFSGISRAWQRGSAMAEHLNHGEYALEQITQALRSAFFPRTGKSGAHYGFVLENNGDGPDARDRISWVKTGSALLRPDDPLRHGTHRVQLSVEEDEFSELGIAARAWRPQILLSAYDPQTRIKPFFFSGKVTGMDCRVATNYAGGAWEWQSEWAGEATNTLPTVVEITVYFEPLEKGDEPVAVRRFVEIPAATRSWGRGHHDR